MEQSLKLAHLNQTCIAAHVSRLSRQSRLSHASRENCGSGLKQEAHSLSDGLVRLRKEKAHSEDCLCFPFVYNRPMRLERITIKPDVCGGEPTIRGMRITVSHVLEMLAGGMTPEQILEDFPYLERADIDACLEYAARQAAHREVLLNR